MVMSVPPFASDSQLCFLLYGVKCLLVYDFDWLMIDCEE